MKAELLGYFGDDLTIANCARVSFGKEKIVFDDKDAKLLKYLVEHGHTSPFRHPQLRFRIECPIFVERQAFKHQIGLTANSLSGRYVDFSDNYFVFNKLRKQSKSSKQGSEGELNRPDLLEKMKNLTAQCALVYKELCEAGVAKEQARAILPLCLETQFIWTGSLGAFLHFWKLRLKSDTQQETCELAAEMLQLVKDIPGRPYKFTLEAFGLSD